MRTETLWSSARNADKTVNFPDDKHAAMTTLVSGLAQSGRWFTPMEVEEHMPDEWKATDEFDTTSIVQAFLPPGFGVEMHGWEDFCIVAI